MWWGRLINCDASEPYCRRRKDSPRHSDSSCLPLVVNVTRSTSTVKGLYRLCNAHVTLHSCNFSHAHHHHRRRVGCSSKPPRLQHENSKSHAVEMNGKNTSLRQLIGSTLNVKVDWLCCCRSQKTSLREIFLVRSVKDFPKNISLHGSFQCLSRKAVL